MKVSESFSLQQQQQQLKHEVKQCHMNELIIGIRSTGFIFNQMKPNILFSVLSTFPPTGLGLAILNSLENIVESDNARRGTSKPIKLSFSCFNAFLVAALSSQA